MTFSQWWKQVCKNNPSRALGDLTMHDLEAAFNAGKAVGRNAEFEEKWIGKSLDYPGGGFGKS